MRQKSTVRLVVILLLVVGTITVSGQWLGNVGIVDQFFGYLPQSIIRLKKANELEVDKRKANLPIQNENEEAPPIPDEIVYFILFNHLVGLQEKSQEMALNGVNLDSHRIYAQRANLDDLQVQFLFQLASDCITAVKSVDVEAKEVIEKSRASMTPTEPHDRDTVPAVPEELKDLQKKRNDTILRFRDQWKGFLGIERFSEFDDLAHQMIVPNVVREGLNKEAK